MGSLLTVRPMPYQRTAVEEIERTYDGRCLLAADPGLGKTLMSFWFLLRNKCDSWPAFVVCPAAVKYQWEQTAAGMGIQALTAEGRTPPPVGRRGFLPPRLIVINYDILHDWADYIKDCHPNTIIIDESQYIADSGSLRTKTVKDLARGRRNRIGLSGTPLLNRPAELWPTLNVLLPKKFPSFWTFANRYCDPKPGRYGGWDFTGASNLEELREELRSRCMIRIRKQDVMKDLPSKMRKVVPVEIDDRREYEFAKNDFRNWLKARFPGRADRAKKAESLVKVGYLLQLCARLKLRAVVGWCNEWLRANPDEKLIVFAWHIKMIEALARRIEGGKHVIINSSVTGRDRTQAIDQFTRDPATRVCIGNIGAMGTGVDGLQRAASTSVIVQLPWAPAAIAQLEDRTNRIGQKETTWYYYLVARGTIDERLCELLQDKLEVIRAVLDGGVLPDDIRILDELAAELEAGRPRLFPAPRL